MLHELFKLTVLKMSMPVLIGLLEVPGLQIGILLHLCLLLCSYVVWGVSPLMWIFFDPLVIWKEASSWAYYLVFFSLFYTILFSLWIGSTQIKLSIGCHCQKYCSVWKILATHYSLPFALTSSPLTETNVWFSFLGWISSHKGRN